MKNPAVVTALALCLGATNAARAQTTYSADYQYMDGTTAHAEPLCSTADVCGTLTFRSGDSVVVYSEATYRCESPTLHVVRRRGTQVLLSYQLFTHAATARRQASNTEHAAPAACPARTAFVAFDRGRVRMAVFTVGNGDLFVRFGAGIQVSPGTTPAFVQLP